MPTDLTNNKLFAALAAVVLVTLIGIVGYFITRPYIQYEEGPFYKTGTVAVGSVRLENKGWFDAEDVRIEAGFTEILTDITSDRTSPFVVSSGGNGFKTVAGSISRISPSQAAYVYFAIDNSSGAVADGWSGVVRQVTFKNGKGSTSQPIWLSAGPILLGLSTGAIIALFLDRHLKQSRELKLIEETAIAANKRYDEWEKRMAEKYPDWEPLIQKLKDKPKEIES